MKADGLKNKFFPVFFLKVIFLGFIASAITKLFLFTYYEIPSDSMENTILPGDGILVNKLQYGARINIDFLSANINFRIPGASSIKRNDIIFFDSPGDSDMTLVKRCVGLPGDTLQIENAELFINRKLVTQPVLFDFKLIPNDLRAFNMTLKYSRIAWTDGRNLKYNIKHHYYQLTVTDSIARIFSKLSCVDTIYKMVKPGGVSNKLFPNSKQATWSRDSYGPLIVPQKGAKLILTNETILTYASVLRYEENKIQIINNVVLLNGKKTINYYFKDNYYFMMGDNRDHSHDSRWIGFIPERNIIGKASYIMYSKDSTLNKVRFERIFKCIK